VYNQAILDAVADKAFDQNLNTDLEHLAHRGYTEGFLKRHRPSDTQNYDYGYSKSDTQQFVGEVLGRNEETGLIDIDVKNKFLTGDKLELMTPAGNVSFTLESMVTTKNGEVVTDAKGSGHKVSIALDTELDLTFGIIMRYLDEGGTTRHPFAQNQTDK
jgi:putative protease